MRAGRASIRAMRKALAVLGLGAVTWLLVPGCGSDDATDTGAPCTDPSGCDGSICLSAGFPESVPVAGLNVTPGGSVSSGLMTSVGFGKPVVTIATEPVFPTVIVPAVVLICGASFTVIVKACVASSPAPLCAVCFCDRETVVDERIQLRRPAAVCCGAAA